jgi:hypothetical protein
MVFDDPPFGALQFTSDEVESVLQDLIPPIILKNCASAFAKSLSLLFHRPRAFFKKGRRNNVEDYRGVGVQHMMLSIFE